jgi:NAD(P)-dependent dehydrogenase (short-subunit alcohol dehydrogenase family)
VTTDQNTSATARPLALVTGANRGIGFEIARGLARAGFRVVLGCRDQVGGEAARKKLASETGNPEIELLAMDLSSQKSIRSAAEEFSRKHSALDVLVNNAASYSAERRETAEGIEYTFATNVMGYHLLTELLLELLKRAPAARIVNVASRMAYGLDISDVNYVRRPYSVSAAYAQSKQANRMLTWALARRLEGTAATANALHPGPVDTPLLSSVAPGVKGIPTSEGSDTAIWLATSPEVAGVSGRFWTKRKEISCEFRGRENEEALWALCDRMIVG